MPRTELVDENQRDPGDYEAESAVFDPRADTAFTLALEPATGDESNLDDLRVDVYGSIDRSTWNHVVGIGVAEGRARRVQTAEDRPAIHFNSALLRKHFPGATAMSLRVRLSLGKRINAKLVLET